ncbi:MFS general substrate transporter [Cristinia sonorae]|uniref:MFS general substrate transporter n=1 Tax=Cristinia sonorae TaxID=1940300 RepID=A0A8K0UIN6_9AGAR|nr:MFS general substrate transporter [Cristinia sonorae]
MGLTVDPGYQPTDPIVNASFTPFSPVVCTESTPLLPARPHRKPFYRPRPLWLVPFAIAASVVRGMTLAPRVQVFTQLSCNAIYGHDVYDHTNLIAIPFIHTPSYHSNLTLPHSDGDDDEPDPRAIPSHRCLSDPAVQAGAARIQTIMTTIGGLLSALTTGWWAHFGERHGRTRVLAAATLGLFLTDLTFILVSTPHSIFAAHGHKFLVVSPIIEGLLGGWTTLQGATSAYVSDCTSDGSRAQIFSRFAGVFYLGFSVGPTIGAYLIRHPLSMPGFPSTASGGIHNGQPTVTSVFYAAAMCSFINLLLVLFVFPESLDKKRAEAAREAAALGLDSMDDDSNEPESTPHGVLSRFFRPLVVFAPKRVQTPDGIQRTDWSLTILAIAIFGYLLSTGVFQIKYLYAGHVYNWGAEQLSYYISFVGLIRALHLLFVMPYLIATFKPKPKVKSTPPQTSGAPAKKPKPTLTQLAKEISFDLWLLRLSLFIDFLSHTLVTLAPASSTHGQAMFIAFTSLSSLASAVSPASNSFALSVMQLQSARAVTEVASKDAGPGQLFAALSMLQAVGQAILGPVVFGVVYSTTVARYPKAIFALSAAIIAAAITLVLFIKPNATLKPFKKQQLLRTPYDPEEDVERGRSRTSKDISRSSPHSIPVSASSSGSSSYPSYTFSR